MNTTTSDPPPPATVSVSIPKETIMRLLKDIRGVMSDKSLEEGGIMYRHSETDILTGFACIVGPSDTLYFGGKVCPMIEVEASQIILISFAAA